MQFCLMPGCGTKNTIFILRQIQEKYFAKKRKICIVFLDLEKAFDQVPRDFGWWTLRKLGVEEFLAKIVQWMHRNYQSQVRVNGTFSDDFLAQVGLHQCSFLSPLLFIIVLEA